MVGRVGKFGIDWKRWDLEKIMGMRVRGYFGDLWGRGDWGIGGVKEWINEGV